MQVAGSLSMTDAFAIELGAAVDEVVPELLHPSIPATTRRGSRKKTEARRREFFPKRGGLLSRARINGITFMIDHYFKRVRVQTGNSARGDCVREARV